MAKKLFTYNVSVSFQMPFTFSESEVEPSEEGDDGDMTPTDATLDSLAKEVEECLSENFVIDKVEACADFDDLLGVEED